MIRLGGAVGNPPELKGGDPGSNPDPGEKFPFNTFQAYFLKNSSI